MGRPIPGPVFQPDARQRRVAAPRLRARVERPSVANPCTLLFVYVFGGTLGAGLGGAVTAPVGSAADRSAYVAYVVPGILLMTVAGVGQGTAIVVAMDMTQGIIARFRTMAIARASVLTGHVLGAIVQSMLATVIVVVVALVIGFRPTTGPVDWIAAAGLPHGTEDCRDPTYRHRRARRVRGEDRRMRREHASSC